MLDAGGGGGTPWESYDMNLMRDLIQNPAVDKQYEILTGWKKTAELIASHQFQVENYRENLAAAWPPKKSAASEAYLIRLDTMIENLKQTYNAALENHRALADATLSLSLAQKKFQPIFDEYQGNQQLLVDFEAKQAAAKTSSTPTPTPSPSGGDQPPVASGRQEELRRQAVTLLSGVSTDLAAAQAKLLTPRPYEPRPKFEDPDPTGGGNFVAPPIPPIAPSYAGSSGAGSSSSTSHSTTFPAGNGAPQATVAAPNAIPSGSNQPGLVLGGTTTPVITPPSPGLPPAPPPFQGGTGGSPITGPGIVPPITNPTFPGGGGATLLPPGGPGGRSGVPSREGLTRPGAPGSGSLRAMPPGGVIGGAPTIGVGQPGSAHPGTRRVNPVGGVIGENPSGSRTTGRVGGAERASATGGTFGQPGARKTGKRSENSGDRWDPDNPWETAEGVDPVVLPASEQRIDPGPAIGLR